MSQIQSNRLSRTPVVVLFTKFPSFYSIQMPFCVLFVFFVMKLTSIYNYVSHEMIFCRRTHTRSFSWAQWAARSRWAPTRRRRQTKIPARQRSSVWTMTSRIMLGRRVSDPHWFNADPDPAFFLIADPDSGSRIRIPDPGSGSRVWWPKIEKKL